MLKYRRNVHSAGSKKCWNIIEMQANILGIAKPENTACIIYFLHVCAHSYHCLRASPLCSSTFSVGISTMFQHFFICMSTLLQHFFCVHFCCAPALFYKGTVLLNLLCPSTLVPHISVVDFVCAVVSVHPPKYTHSSHPCPKYVHVEYRFKLYQCGSKIAPSHTKTVPRPMKPMTLQSLWFL